MVIRFVAAIIMVWILGFAWFGLWLPQPAAADLRTDGVVVLTGEGGRIARGLSVLTIGEAERMLISGVDRDVKRGELEALYPEAKGQFECCIDLGFKAVDTRSNALETARWVDRNSAKSIRLVTSDWHMRRARLELDMVLSHDISVVEDAVQTQPSLYVLITEYHKFLLRYIAAGAGI